MNLLREGFIKKKKCICTSFGFEPLHQKMYYSFILSSEFNKVEERNGKKSLQPLAGWFFNISIEGGFCVLLSSWWFTCFQWILPTKLQALKLHFFLKDEAGRKNWTVTLQEITGKVGKFIKHYWVFAGYETVSSPKNRIAKLLKDCQFQHKKKNMSNKKSLEVRSKFEEDLTKLLDIDKKIILRKYSWGQNPNWGNLKQLQRFLLSGGGQ